MNRPEAGYQLEDIQTVQGWLADASLTATMTGLTSGWGGFVDAVGKINTATAKPPPSPANPNAAAAWRLGYGTDLSERRALTGGLLQGLPAILYFTLAVQPHVAITVPYQLGAAIRDGVATLARASSISVNSSPPMARTFDLGPWSAWSIIIRFWSVS